MQIDTDEVLRAAGLDPGRDPVAGGFAASRAAIDASAMTGGLLRAAIGKPIQPGPSRGDEDLLSHFDARFMALIRQELVEPGNAALLGGGGEGDGDGMADQRLLDAQALADYLTLRQAGRPADPTDLQQALKRAGMDRQGRRGIIRALGPRVVVGFDAEWVRSKRGKNLIICVQLYLIGPTGKTHVKVIELIGPDGQGYRPRLSDALAELLDEADAEGVIDEWPHEVLLAGHFTRADLTAFADFKELRSQLDGVNGTFATVAEPAVLKPSANFARETRLKSKYHFLVENGIDLTQLTVRVVDTSRIAPPGTPLEKIGQWLGEPKIELPAGFSKEDMLSFARKEPARFREYAVHDARLAALYAIWTMWFCDRFLGLRGLSSTVSGIAVRLAEQCMRRDGVHPDVALNFDTRKRTAWGVRDDRPITISERVPTPIRRWLEPFVSDAFLGGRNECFQFGPSKVGTFYDPDLAGAYVTGLAYVQSLDYSKAYTTRDVKDLIGHVAAFAEVKFKFPPGTRFPCLPQRVGDFGLWFAQEGVSIATAPEIELALAMGAEIEILFAVVIPWKKRADVFLESAQRLRMPAKSAKKSAKATAAGIDESLHCEAVRGMLELPGLAFPPESHGDTGYRPMESFAIYVRQMRLLFRRKSLAFEFMKVIGNGLYGKVGQGHKGKRQFGPREMESRLVGPSRMSEAAIAALVCGFIRAVVGEILWKLPASATAISVTTDGMLIDVPPEQMDLSGEMCRRYQALVDRVAPGTSMIELKHQVRQVFAARTRGQFTTLPDGDHPLVIAKAGHKVVLDGDEAHRQWLMSPAGQSDFMVRLALNRYPGQVLVRDMPFSARQPLENDWDFQKEPKDVKVALEFDFKRMPVDARMVQVEGFGVEHLAFDTVPWPTADQGELVRTIFDRWRQTNCLKSMDDWNRWRAEMTLRLRNRRIVRVELAASDSAAVSSESDSKDGATAGGSTTRGVTGRVYARGGEDKYLRIVVRTFLSAFVKRAWGLSEPGLSQAELATWLTEQGYPVKLHDVKNAGRSVLNENVAVHAPDVQRFLALVKGRFTTLEVERFLVAEV